MFPRKIRRERPANISRTSSVFRRCSRHNGQHGRLIRHLRAVVAVGYYDWRRAVSEEYARSIQADLTPETPLKGLKKPCRPFNE
jgi:hypothetical protein